ncbi:MAG: ZIP family metal transporter [Pseudolysinimonas sp.]|uniref:ZIP family metal transporter n=1 Tax=Pseudolysinimonas sp. TaxID=2680009 RepID=UPI003C71D948
MPRWLLGIGPLVLIATLIGLFTLLNAPGVTGDGNRIPQEEIVVETIQLHPGQIVLTVRNEGADPVSIAQVNVSDYYAQFTQTREELARLESDIITISYDWVEGDPYEITLVTSTGGTIGAEIVAAAATPERGASFFGLMTLLGVYVGVIPIGIGLLWMPFVRRSSKAWVRALMAFTIGLLAFLTIDATLEGLELVAGTTAFGGGLIVFLGALAAYLTLEGVEGIILRRRVGSMRDAALPARTVAFLIATGIGLHNFGEGLAIGSAYAVGSLALGAFLVIGFAIHNTTEGLAIVTPLAAERPRLRLLVLLGLIAGAPAIVGAILGGTALQPNLVALLFGVGAGAVGQVAVKLLPRLTDEAGRMLTPLTAGGIVVGLGFMFATGLLVAA